MSELNEGELFLCQSTNGSFEASETCDIDGVPEEENFDDDASQFTTSTIDSMDRQDIDGDLQSRPTQDCPSSVPVPVSNLVQNSGPAPSEITMLENPGVSSLTSSSEHPEPPNDLYLSKKRLFLSLSTWKWVGNTVASFSCQLN